MWHGHDRWRLQSRLVHHEQLEMSFLPGQGKGNGERGKIKGPGTQLTLFSLSFTALLFLVSYIFSRLLSLFLIPKCLTSSLPFFFLLAYFPRWHHTPPSVPSIPPKLFSLSLSLSLSLSPLPPRILSLYLPVFYMFARWQTGRWKRKRAATKIDPGWFSSGFHVDSVIHFVGHIGRFLGGKPHTCEKGCGKILHSRYALLDARLYLLRQRKRKGES